MKKILVILSSLFLSIGAVAQTGQVNHGGTGLNAAANNSILVGTGPNTYVLVNVPDCQDANGNHLNYTAGSYVITCGTSSAGINSGTPYQVTRYNAAGNAIQDSTGSDNPANGPTRWTNGLSVTTNGLAKQGVNSPNGTVVNLLACADPTVTTMLQITVCPAGTTKAYGVVDNGAGVTGNVQIYDHAYHACVFDNQTSVSDYVAPSAINDGQCSDVGASKPNNVEIIGKVTTVNSGVGTLATVDWFTGDTVAPGSSGGSGTVSNSCAGMAYYPSSGTTIVGDCLFLTDGSGHVTMYSLGLLDSTYAGFMYQKQGPLPPAAPANSIEKFPPTSVPTAYSVQDSSTPGTAGQCYQVTGTTTDTNGHTIDQMGYGACGSGGGSGTVTSVGQTVNSGSSSGIFAVTGSPVTTAGTLNINTAGTSGGIPYFSSSSIVSSSSTLTAHGVVIGEGAGSSPTSTGTGSLGQVLTSNGPSADPTFQAPGGSVVPCSDGLIGTCVTYPNDPVTGTATNLPVIWKQMSTNEQRVKQTSSSEYQKGWATGVIGICISGCGTAGNAIVKVNGQAACTFESGNAPATDGFVEIGATGKCFYNGAAGINENPEVHLFFAKANTTGAAGSTTTVNLLSGEAASAAAAGSVHLISPAQPSMAVMTPGSPFFTPGPFYLEQYTTATAGTTLSPISSARPFLASDSGHRYYNGTSGGYFDVYADQNGTGRYRLTVNTAGAMAGALGGASLRAACAGTSCPDAQGNGHNTSEGPASFYTPPDIETVTGAVTYQDNNADTYVWTVTGNLTITAATPATYINVGHVTHWVFIQDGSGGHAVTLPSEWAGVGVAQPPPTVTTTANAVTTIDCVWTSTSKAYCR